MPAVGMYPELILERTNKVEWYKSTIPQLLILLNFVAAKYMVGPSFRKALQNMHTL